MQGAELESPVGPITVLADGDVVHRVRFRRLADRDPAVQPAAPDSLASRLAGQLTGYFAGTRTVLDAEPDWSRLDDTAAGVLRTLVRIASFGRTVSYGELADASGLTSGAARAVGTVLNGNPWPVLVPCHRVIMSDGSLGGFGAGRWRKEALLKLEGSLPETLWDL